ncbi:MAG: hypothetical protein AAF798_20075, partial [Bacteroidota bacterium]
MKQTVPFVIFLSLVCSLTAQISISNDFFPAAGDTLYSAVDNLPSGITITPAGGDQTWDFTTLQAPFTRQTVYKSAGQGNFGASFPEADIVAQSIEVGELYYTVTDTEFTLV